MTSTYRAPAADLEFLLTRVLDLAQLKSLPAFEGLDEDMVRSVLAQGARHAESVLAPINAVGDAHPARLVDGGVIYSPGFADAYRQYCADGWMGLDLPQRLGGQGMPRLLQAAFAEMTNGANIAFSMLPVTVRAAAKLLLAHGTPELVVSLIPAMIQGSCAATIAITEPEAGSDVGRIRSMAVEQPDGRYRLSGTKIFISNADNDFTGQIVHMVLARTPEGAPGTRGLSLFVVPKFTADKARNGVSVMRVEHKMGLKASPTCVVEFDGAEAVRIGAAGRGLQAMFAMVNTMRLEVAVQGVAVGGAALHRALQYALDRTQGGAPSGPPRPIIEHADVRRMLLTMRARIEALRALTLEAALQLDLGENHPDAEVAGRALGLSQWLLPICKACATDAGLDVANLAVQVFGGAGYVTDTGVEQYVRDVRVGSIYEGTNGIQAIDLVTRKLIVDGATRCREFLALIRGAVQRAAAQEQASSLREAVSQSVDLLERVSSQMMEWSAQGRAADIEAGAVAYLRLAGLVGCGWMWLRMAVQDSGSPELNASKRACAEYFVQALLPETRLLAHQATLGTAGAELSGAQWQAGW